MTNKEILKLKFKSGDLNRTVTVGNFFTELLKALWIEGESFSGKRPFGNSGWDGDLIVCFIKNDIIKCELDEDGYIKKFDFMHFNKIVLSLIEELS